MDQVIEKLQNADTIMEVTDLCKFFKAGKKQVLKAVDHVTVSIKRGETQGLPLSAPRAAARPPAAEP